MVLRNVFESPPLPTQAAPQTSAAAGPTPAGMGCHHPPLHPPALLLGSNAPCSPHNPTAVDRVRSTARSKRPGGLAPATAPRRSAAHARRRAPQAAASKRAAGDEGRTGGPRAPRPSRHGAARAWWARAARACWGRGPAGSCRVLSALADKHVSKKAGGVTCSVPPRPARPPGRGARLRWVGPTLLGAQQWARGLMRGLARSRGQEQAAAPTTQGVGQERPGAEAVARQCAPPSGEARCQGPPDAKKAGLRAAAEPQPRPANEIHHQPPTTIKI